MVRNLLFFLKDEKHTNSSKEKVLEDMVAYEFYWRDDAGRDHLIGLVPERRKKPERITPESVSKWVKTFLDDITDFDFDNVHIIRRDLKFTSPLID